MAPHHTFLWLLLLTEICTAFQDREEIGCSLPPVKKGEKATLTCSYNFKLTAGVTVTVNGQGLHIGGSDKGIDVQVLILDYTEEGWENPIVYPHFQLRHISNVTDGMKWTVVIDILNATEEYEGLYTCQLIGNRVQQCNFFLDTLNTEMKNSSTLLLHLTNHSIKEIQLRKHFLDSAEVKKITVDPPKKSYLLHDMESDTAYVIKVHVDQMGTPLTRTVCLPAVRNLTTEAVSASTIRVHWEASLCHSIGTGFTYQICHKKADSVEHLRCFPSKTTSVLLSDLEAETEYQIRVNVRIRGKNVGSVAQRQSTTSQGKTVDDIKHGDTDKDGSTVFIIVATVVLLIVVLVFITCICARNKPWMRLKGKLWLHQATDDSLKKKHEVDDAVEEDRQLLDIENQLPNDVNEEQDQRSLMEDGADGAGASGGGISAQEGPDEIYQLLKNMEKELESIKIKYQELELEQKNMKMELESVNIKCQQLESELASKGLEQKEEKLSQAEKENCEVAVKEARPAEDQKTSTPCLVSCSPAALSDDSKLVRTESSPSSITPVPEDDTYPAQTQEDRATDSILSASVKNRHNPCADANSKNNFAMASPQTSMQAHDVQDSKRSGQ